MAGTRGQQRAVLNQGTGAGTGSGASIPPSGGHLVKNDSVFAPATLRKYGNILAAAAVLLTLGGCGGKPPQLLSSNPDVSSAPPSDPRGQLAALVAAAQDQHFVGAYTLHTDGRADRTVLVSRAVDGSSRIDVPGGALGGGADVSIAANATGIFQCVLSGPATTLATATSSPGPDPSASPANPAFPAPACVRLAGPGGQIPKKYDPVIPHIFTDWMTVMTDRNAPILVFQAAALPGSSGQCFSVEPSSASMAPPMQAGIFCYLPDGTLTAAAIAHNRLTIIGQPAPAPPTDPLPGPVIDGPAAPIKAP